MGARSYLAVHISAAEPRGSAGARKSQKPAIGCDFATALCAIARILDDIGYQSHKVFEARDD
jgi:hypothetical protein